MIPASADDAEFVSGLVGDRQNKTCVVAGRIERSRSFEHDFRGFFGREFFGGARLIHDWPRRPTDLRFSGVARDAKW